MHEPPRTITDLRELDAWSDSNQPIPSGMAELDGKLMPLTQARHSARRWAGTVRPIGRAPRLATNSHARGSRRTSSSSRTASADPPGDDESDSPGRRRDLRHVGVILDAYLQQLGGPS